MLPTSDGLPFTGQIMILVEAEIDLIAFSKKWSCGTEIIDYLSRLVYRQGCTGNRLNHWKGGINLRKFL